MKDFDNLISVWVSAQGIDPETDEYEKVSWAVDELISLASSKPEQLWELIPKILEYDSSEKILGAIGAGLVEDLLTYHGIDFIDKVSLRATNSDVFKGALRYTYLDDEDVSPEVFKKFKAIEQG